MQDSKGYMWFGTDRGVCKFNGYKFETFTTADGLCYNTVFQIHEDYKKRIWFISNSNQLCFYEGNQVKQHSANKQLQKLFPNTILRSFYLDAGDTIWLAVNDYGLIKITPDNTIITVHRNEMQYIKIFDNKHFRLNG
jgi:ligand-binding sensor domain-containing protein